MGTNLSGFPAIRPRTTLLENSVQRTIAAVLSLLVTLPLVADDEKRLTAERLWQLDRVGSPVISPDGTQVVVPVTSYDAETDEAETRLWLLAARGDPLQRPLTAAGARASDPVFSPDGGHLAFVSQRGKDEAGQVYVLPMDGPGEAVRLTEVPTGAGALRWEGEFIYFVSQVWPGKTWEEMAEAVKAEKDKKVSAWTWTEMPYAYFDHFLDQDRQRHLYRVPAGGGEVEAITPGTGVQLSRTDISSDHYDVSPDGKRLAFVANSAPGAVYPNFDVFELELGSDQAVNLTAGNPADDGNPMFSPDGERLAWLAQAIPGFYGDTARIVLREGGDTRTLHAGWDRSVGSVTWRPDGEGFYAAVGDAATVRLFDLPVDGAPRAITGANDFGAPSVARDGTLVATHQSFTHPVRIARVDPASGAATRLDTFNDEALAGVDMGTYESVTYEGAGGAEIQMWVHYPPGFDRRREYPLLMLIHGGPHGAITDSFHYRWNAQLFAGWGYVAAWPNFHGSSSFGQDFTDAINPDWITKPYADVIAASEWLMDKPWIDGDRVVSAGASYGGYLSSILLGREHPFNAMVIHAAVYDLYAQNAADFSVHAHRFGPYWENPDLYRDLSPHTYAANFRTPSLIIHGQNDLRVPVGQGFELFRTLQTLGVESKLIYYPDENHWVLKRSNSLHWYGEVKDWVTRYAQPGPR